MKSFVEKLLSHKKNRWRITAMGAFFLVLFLLGFFSSRGSSVEVEVAQVVRGDVVETVKATGTVEAGETVDVKAPIEGKIKKLHVKDGEHVEAGELLLEFDEGLLRQSVDQAEIAYQQALSAKERLDGGTDRVQVSQAKAALDQANVAYDEAKKALEDAEYLFREKAIAREQLDQARFAYKRAKIQLESAREQYALSQKSLPPSEKKAAQAQLNQARDQLDRAYEALEKSKVYAPSDGMVVLPTDLLGGGVREGSPVTQGQVLFALAKDDRLKISSLVDVYEADKIKPGQSVIVRSDLAEGELPGQVISVHPGVVSREAFTGVRVEVALEEGVKLRIGSTVNLEIVTGFLRGVPLVPREALKDGAVLAVERHSAPRAVSKRVQTGVAGSSGLVEVKAGLAEGEWVILNPANIQNGQRVKVRGW